TDPQIAAARCLLHRRNLIAESRDDGREVARHGDLGYEEDGILELRGGDDRGEKQTVHALPLSGPDGKRTCSPSPRRGSDAMMSACGSALIAPSPRPRRRGPDRGRAR